MLNRERDEIIRDILITTNNDEIGISKIMFHAYLSHSQAKAYLSELMANGMISNSETVLGKQFYKITPKGHDSLHALESMVEMIKPSRQLQNLDYVIKS